jgi:hypothetical protein
MVVTIVGTSQVKKMILRVKGDFSQEFYHSRKTFTNFVGTILYSLEFKYSLSWATLEAPLALFEHVLFFIDP